MPKHIALIFDISGLSDEIRTPYRHQPWADVAIVSKHPADTEIQINFWGTWNSYLSGIEAIELTGEDYLQFLLMKHLPWEVIVDYFSNQTN